MIPLSDRGRGPDDGRDRSEAQASIASLRDLGSVM